MADIKFRVIRDVMRTGTGTQQFTLSGFGTVKAAIFLISRTTADNTANNGAAMGWGATDGTRQWAWAVHAGHNQAASDPNRRGMSDRCIHICTNAGGIDGEAEFSQWVTDGVEVNVSTAFNGQYHVMVILCGGADLNVRVDSLNLQNNTSVNTYPSMGFEADLLWLFGCNNGFGDSAEAFSNTTLGFVANHGGGSITQRCMSDLILLQNLNEDEPRSWMMEDKGHFQVDPNTGALLYETTFSNFGSSGFDFQSSGATGSDRVGMIAFDLGGAAFSVGTYQPPTGNTTSTVSASFTPQFTMLLLNGIPNVDEGASFGEYSGNCGVSLIDDTRQFCAAMAVEWGSATTDTQTICDDQAINFPRDTGAAWYTGTFTGFSGSGTGLSFSAVSGATRKWIQCQIEEGSASNSYSLTIEGGSYVLSGSAVGLKRGYPSTIGSGSYTITGANVGLKQGYPITVGGGSYSLSGSDVNFQRTYVFPVESGEYTIEGSDVGLAKTYPLSVGGGSYTLTGSDVNFRHAHTITVASGTYDITGSAVGLKRGYPINVGSGSYTISGGDVNFNKDWAIAINSGSYNISGSAVGLKHGYSIPVGAESYEITGDDVEFLRSYNAPIEGGSYTLSGSIVNLVYGEVEETLIVEGGSYTISGSAVGLKHGYKSQIAGGSYTISGSTVSFAVAHRVTIGGGSYSLTGTAVLLRFSPKIAVASGAYTLTGAQVLFRHAFKTVIASGSYTVSGSNVNFQLSHKVLVASGSYTISGSALEFIYSRAIVCESGVYTLTGSDVILTYTPLSNFKAYWWKGTVLME